jgi:hypothetical protein
MTATPGRLIIPISEPIFTQEGLLDPGATLTVYLTGTTTLATLYSSSALTSTITNPQTANSAGRFYAQSTAIYADATQAYDVVVTLTDGEVLTFDGIVLVAAIIETGSYALLSGATFTGPVYGVTPSTADNSNLFATTAYVQNNISPLAPLASPTFSGTPEAPTASAGTDTTQIATTAYVQGELETSNLSASTAVGTTFSSWNPATGLVVVKGVYLASITTEQTITITLPINVGQVVWYAANALNANATNNGNTVAQVKSATTTTLSVYLNDSQTGGQANATGFWWEVNGYSATEPTGV